MRLTSACRGIFLAGSCYWSLVFPCPAWALDGNHEAWAAFRQDNWTLTEKLTAGLADDPEAILLRANAASRAGNTDLARQVLEEGRKRFPQDARFVVNLSIVLSRDGKNEEAVQTIEGFFASRDDTRDAFRTLRTIQGRAAREAYGRALGVELETLPPLALLEPLVPKTIEPPSRNLVAASVAPSVPAPLPGSRRGNHATSIGIVLSTSVASPSCRARPLKPGWHAAGRCWGVRGRSA